jgi:prepilin-type processing-associated H-X9-DG protein
VSAGPGSYAAGKTDIANNNYPGWRGTIQWDGIFFVTSKLNLGHVTRGTSNVIMVGERYLNTLNYRTGTDPGDNEATYVGMDNDINRNTFNPPLQDRNGFNDTFRFGSAHNAALNVLFCDGSVRSIAYEIDPTVWKDMGKRFD